MVGFLGTLYTKPEKKKPKTVKLLVPTYRAQAVLVSES